MTPDQRTALTLAFAHLELAGLQPELSRHYGSHKTAAILLDLPLTDEEVEAENHATADKARVKMTGKAG